MKEMIQVCLLWAATPNERGSDFAVVRLSIHRQARTAARITSGTNMRPARSNWMPAAPTITSGTANCTAAVPMLPPAALRPSARPFSFSG